MDYGLLARSYNTLGHSRELRDILEKYVIKGSIASYSKFELHQKINETLYRNYHGEEILKYKLADCFKNKDYVSAFEVKALKSRADFLVINGYTSSFEIKSKIDSLSRLSKQVLDYSDVFEFNTVVIDVKHLSKVETMIPEHYGIWYFEKRRKVEYRAALLSPSLNAVAQLNLFTKRELRKFFGTTELTDVLIEHLPQHINQKMKEMLKQRYAARWSFVKNNWASILPVDLQFFFNTNISPELIYHT